MRKTLLYGALGGLAIYFYMRSRKKMQPAELDLSEAEPKPKIPVTDVKPAKPSKVKNLVDKIKDLPTINKEAKPVSKVLIKKPKDEKPPKFGDPRGKEDFFGDDVPRDAMPKPPAKKTPPPAKVITPISEGNATIELDEPRTPPAPTVEPVLSVMPSFVDQRDFYDPYSPNQPKKPKVVQFGDPRGRFDDREDFYGGSRPTDRRGRPMGMPKPALSSPAPPDVRRTPIRPTDSKPKPVSKPIPTKPYKPAKPELAPPVLDAGDTKTFTIPRIDSTRPAVARIGKGSRSTFKPPTRRIGKGSRR